MKTKSIPPSRTRTQAARVALTLFVGWLGLLGPASLQAASPPKVTLVSPFTRLTNGIVNVKYEDEIVPDTAGPRMITLETSSNLVNWVAASTNTLLEGVTALFDPTFVPGLHQRFYRVAVLPGGPFAPGEVLLRFRGNVPSATAAAVMRLYNLSTQEVVRTPLMADAGAAGFIRASTTQPVWITVQHLRGRAEIEFAEPNWIYSLHDQANDPLFPDPDLWGMWGSLCPPVNVYGSQAADAWAQGYTGSPNICVGVIDTGIDFNHPDLAGNVWSNPWDAPGGGDNDGNGYVDDLRGWNFNEDNNNVFDDGFPYGPHGTHVAGTIGARGNNGLGVAGINWQVKLVTAKCFGPNPPTLDKFVKAIDYLTRLKTRGPCTNLVAINSSYGYLGCGADLYSKPMHEAILRAAKARILFVCSAGNTANDNDQCPNYPCNYDTTVGAGGELAADYNAVISVAALDRYGDKAPFSSYGANTVHLAAPGVDVLSTWLGGSYYVLSGTSMAAPHVTGALALYASTHPGADAPQIRSAILNGTTPTPSMAGKAQTGGRLDLSKVVCPTGSGTIDVDSGNTTPPYLGTVGDPFQTVAAGYNAAGCGNVLRIIGNNSAVVRVYTGVPSALTKCLTLVAPNGPVLLQP